MIIAIDGETATFKSKISKCISDSLHFIHVSVGVIFRMITHDFLETKQKKITETFMDDFFKRISFSTKGLLYNGKEIIDSALRSQEIFEKCPEISSDKMVCEIVYAFLQSNLLHRNAIVEGRNVGSKIFPEANFCFFFLSTPSLKKELKTYFSHETLDKLTNINNADIKNGIICIPDNAEKIKIYNYRSLPIIANYIISKIKATILGSVEQDKMFALIPARSGSTSLKDKNIRILNGHPLIAYSIEIAKKIGIEKIIVSTDSPKYKLVAEASGAIVPFIRPKEISDNLSCDIDFFRHAIYMLYGAGYRLPQYFIFLRATTPIRNVYILEDALAKFKSNPNASSLRTAHPSDKSPFKMFRMVDGFFKPIFDGKTIDDINVPRQILPASYIPNSYVDIIKTENIIIDDSLYGDSVMAYLTEPTIDIDNENDFLQCESLLKERIVYNVFEE